MSNTTKLIAQKPLSSCVSVGADSSRRACASPAGISYIKRPDLGLRQVGHPDSGRHCLAPSKKAAAFSRHMPACISLTHTHKKNLGNIPQSPRVLNSQRPVPTLRTLIKLSAGEKAAERRRRLARCQMFHFNQVGTFFPARLVWPCVGADKVLKDATAAHRGRSAVAASAPVTEDARQSHEQKTSSESKHRLNL